jgi:glycosyltransferase involved in cell wall biosynthesis
MKILFLEQFSELGGGQRNLLDLLPAVAARGWKAVVAAPGNGPLLERARAAGAEILPLSIGGYTNGRKTMGDAARFAVDTIRLRGEIARQDCDAISIGGARLLPAVALGAHGRPVIFQAQHFMEDSRALGVARRAVERSRAKVIANSRHVALQFGTPDVVYNGVDEIPFTERKFCGPWRIGIVGRIAPMKGQVDFLRAAKRIVETLPGSTFVICGAPLFCPPAYAEEVQSLARDLPVEFLGWRDDAGAVLRDLDLLLAPSTPAEATTRVILEAFSAGVPVVAYAAGGIAEVVRNGDNGFLVPECTPEALARKVVEASSGDLRGIARRAREDWERNYTVERYREQMMEILGSYLTQPGMT